MGLRTLGMTASLLLSCSADQPHEPARSAGTTEALAAPAPRLDLPSVLPTPSKPLSVRIAPRPETFFVSQSCLGARGTTASNARAQCAKRKRRGERYEQRLCRCDRKEIIEVRADDPIAFYVGCCNAVGDTPQKARNLCETRRAEGWCESEDPDLVHVATGPHPRNSPFREFDGPDFHFLVPSDLEGIGWITDGGAPPCFPDGTLVQLEDGPRAIEHVRAGDRVLTLREGRRVYVPVLGVKVREANTLLTFTFEAGALRVTPNHLVWLEGDWREASEVDVGDVLTGLEGPTTVLAIDETRAPVTVRTLEVGAPDSFFAEGIWVHNY